MLLASPTTATDEPEEACDGNLSVDVRGPVSVDTVRPTLDICESTLRARLVLTKAGPVRLAVSSRGRIAMTNTYGLVRIATMGVRARRWFARPERLQRQCAAADAASARGLGDRGEATAGDGLRRVRGADAGAGHHRNPQPGDRAARASGICRRRRVKKGDVLYVIDQRPFRGAARAGQGEPGPGRGEPDQREAELWRGTRG